MHILQSFDMVSLHEIAAALESRMTDLLIVSDSYSWIVRVISWFFITLALSFWTPIAVLIAFDFVLWIYRLVVPTAATNPQSRRRRESLSHPVSTS
ncbi:hypothetical protein BD289DRAFT_485944 [Coniella lustricola]|uniref:Uncharacterized protein n=1 Tax=Coniella lustricola TaxID=2025994 RepID=A0A2T2ZWR8_9PEZI|nr:hypothetical protein BD289DRAFT_485944 [Coniella lustricola]